MRKILFLLRNILKFLDQNILYKVILLLLVIISIFIFYPYKKEKNQNKVTILNSANKQLEDAITSHQKRMKNISKIKNDTIKAKETYKSDSIKNNEIYKAEKKYEKALEKDTAYYKAHINKTHAQYRQDNFQKSSSSYKQALIYLKNKKDSSKIYYSLGNSLLKEGTNVLSKMEEKQKNKRIEESIDAYKKSLRINPGNLNAKKALAIAQSLIKPPMPPSPKTDPDVKKMINIKGKEKDDWSSY